MKNITIFTAIIISALLSAGCMTKKTPNNISKNVTEPATTETRPTTTVTSTAPLPTAGDLASFLRDANGNLVLDANGNPIPIDTYNKNNTQAVSDLDKRLFFFDFDSFELAANDLTILAAHAKYLVTHAAAKVRLIGHTDERGTREYNLALGEKRAKAAQNYLVFNGAKNEQIDVVSYGKEQPLNLGHDESAWAENRRVEIKYEQDAPK